MERSKKSLFFEGLRAGIPICLGYLAVSFSIGICAKNAGLNVLQGLLASLLNNASAGEYALFTAISSPSPYVEVLLVTLVANARYLLMGFAMAQKLSPDMSIPRRMLVGFDLTDEVFGVIISKDGYVPTAFIYGTFVLPILGWSTGTVIGIIAGNVLPISVVQALSASLYGMFLAVFVPQAKKDLKVGIFVLVSFAASLAASLLPYISALSDGTRIIILTVVISAIAAAVCPIQDKVEEKNGR